MAQVIIRRRLTRRDPEDAPKVDTDVEVAQPVKPRVPVARRSTYVDEEDLPSPQQVLNVPPPMSAPVPATQFDEVPAPPVRIQPVNKNIVEDVIMKVMTALGDGRAILIVRLSEDRWQINPVIDAKNPVAMQKKLSGKAYWDEVLDPHYIEWDKEWQTLTQAEKVQRCKKAGVVWEEDKDVKINNIHMTEAYRTKLGIEKYKPEYRDRSSRAAVRG